MPTHLHRRLRTASIVALVTLQAGCVAAHPPAPAPRPIARSAPAPQPTPTSAPLPAPPPTGWLDAPHSSGDWHYSATSDGGAAQYGDRGNPAQFSVLCHRTARTVELVRQGAVTSATPMVVRTTIRDGAVTAQPSTGPVPSAFAVLSASDPLLDTMAFSRGRFAIEVAGLATLYLPAWPELARVIEDCR